MNREQFYKELIEAVIEKHGDIVVSMINKGPNVGKFIVGPTIGCNEHNPTVSSFNFTTALILLLAKDSIINSNKK